MTDIEIQVEGIDLSDKDIEQVLDELSCEWIWSAADGLVTFTVLASDENPTEDAVKALRVLRSKLPQAKPVRVFEEQVSIPDIARRVGLSREAVRKWVDAGDKNGFPAPVQCYSAGERGNARAWNWRDVTRWLLDVKGIDLEEELPDFATVTEINSHIAGLHHGKASHAPFSQWHMVKVFSWQVQQGLSRQEETRSRTAWHSRIVSP